MWLKTMDPSGISVLTAQRQWFLCFSPFLSMNNYRSPVPLGFGQLANLGVPRASTTLVSLSTSIPQEFVEAIMEDVDTRLLLISGFCTVNQNTNESQGTGGNWDGEAPVKCTCGRRRRRDRAAGTKRSAEVEGGRSALELPGEEARQGRRWRQKERNRQRIGRLQTRGSKRVYNGSGASADAVEGGQRPADTERTSDVWDL
ncbi:hypothetical protein B0H14DRAFT_3559923 [Mycena olivaceomarginata]|nr:hypothetical protein B0H14DRAFT_3559923 [Mycena olivaceomarginata]